MKPLTKFILIRPARIVGLGVLLWLIPLLVFLPLEHAWHGQPWPSTAIMPLTLALCGVVFSVYYFRYVRQGYVREGLNVGLTWMLMAMLMDLPLYLHGPIARPLHRYLIEVALAYLIYPIITIGMGAALRMLAQRSQHAV